MDPRFGHITAHLGLELVDEHCETIKFAKNFNLNRLMHLMRENKDKLNMRLLDTVDEYGMTVFNQIQITILLNEIKQILCLIEDGLVKEYVKEIFEFIKQSEDKVGEYVRFLGD